MRCGDVENENEEDCRGLALLLQHLLFLLLLLQLDTAAVNPDTMQRESSINIAIVNANVRNAKDVKLNDMLGRVDVMQPSS